MRGKDAIFAIMLVEGTQTGGHFNGFHCRMQGDSLRKAMLLGAHNAQNRISKTTSSYLWCWQPNWYESILALECLGLAATHWADKSSQHFPSMIFCSTSKSQCLVWTANASWILLVWLGPMNKSMLCWVQKWTSKNGVVVWISRCSCIMSTGQVGLAQNDHVSTSWNDL